MDQFGFWFDMARCIGCKACQVACKEANRLPPGAYFRRADACRYGEGADKLDFRYSGGCNHCSQPACAAICPTGAMRKEAGGLVLHHDELCIGCGRCVHACPYGAPFLDGSTGLSRKCDACKGEPVCAAACPTRALEFGPLDELRLRHRASQAVQPAFLPGAQQTGPALLVGNIPPALRRPQGEPSLPDGGADPVPGEAMGLNYVVLGGGAAAVAAAQELRRRDPAAHIRIFSQETVPPYSRPMLSKALLRGFRLERYTLADAQWLAEHQVELHLGHKAIALDAENRVVTFAGGERVHYDKCIYALGAEAAVPAVPGTDKAGVFTLRSFQDVQRIRMSLPGTRQAVIVGGGAVGLELAVQLSAQGISTTVVEALPRLLERQLDESLSARLRARLEELGIQVAAGARLQAICGGKRVESVLVDAVHIPAQTVILAAGIRANTSLARSAGLAADRFVEVNEYMQTSLPHVYACGDCASCRGAAGGSWVQARSQAAAAAANAAGARTAWTPNPAPFVLHAAGTAVFSVGRFPSGDDGAMRLLHGGWNRDGRMFFVNPDGGTQTQLTFCLDEGRLVGAALVGGLELSGWLEEAVRRRLTRAALLEAAAERRVLIHER